jgi:hypothetical protein
MSVADWSSKEKDVLREWLIGTLNQGEMTIEFEKKDGSLRKMKCTLKDVPVVEKKTDAVRKQNDEVLAVYDVEAQGWRSFRLDSIKQIEGAL